VYLRSTQMARGDYLASHRGDPGLFGFLGKIVKTGLGAVSKLGIPGISGAAGIARGMLGGGIRRVAQTQQYSQQAGPGGRGLEIPGVAAGFHRAFKGGQTGFYATKRRRMNPGNVKALRRAMRRQDAFVKLARRALRGSKYKIATVGSSRSRPISIRESGPGGVTVQR